ncbi:MAG: LTA synthase family protein, partial [Deltaproteobacteria bacterium]|nr:LTA synthase family protein [Deltaproteobacteria bacterium]
MLFPKNRPLPLAPSSARFGRQLRQDVLLAAFVVATLQALRLGLLLLFREGLGAQTGAGELLRGAGAGLRFDAQVGFYAAAPSLVATLVCAGFDAERFARALRRGVGTAYCLLLPLLAAISAAYVDEYGDLFNHFMFGALYDDFGAVLRTVWNEHPVIPAVLLVIAASWGLTRLWRRALSPALPEQGPAGSDRGAAREWVSIAVALLLLVGAARGGVGRVPVQFRDRDVTSDEFLNNLVLNPVSAIRYAIKHHLKVSRRGELPSVLASKGIREVVRGLFPDRPIGDRIDPLLARTAAGLKGLRPRHVFLVVGESYDAWPLLDRYRALDLLPECRRLGKDGLLLTSFVSGASGTAPSLGVLIAGLYDPGPPINYQPQSRRTYPTATAAIFRRLGYRTRLYYGGFLSWQRLGDFARAQGFEETYSRAHIPKPRQVNEWGVDDASLFDLVLRTVKDDAPSFNLIMTTSNHPPYNFDLASEGWVPRRLPPELARLADGRLSDAMMGHLWHADRCMGRFVEAARAKLPAALFAVTGDHFSRKFLNHRPPLFERSAVPLLLYGPEVLKGLRWPAKAAGGHIDVPTTLIELCAPTGFAYASLGRDLLAPSAEPVGFGRGTLLAADYAAGLGSSAPLEPVPGAPLGRPA